MCCFTASHHCRCLDHQTPAGCSCSSAAKATRPSAISLASVSTLHMPTPSASPPKSSAPAALSTTASSGLSYRHCSRRPRFNSDELTPPALIVFEVGEAAAAALLLLSLPALVGLLPLPLPPTREHVEPPLEAKLCV
jgi:hypothetical protein